MQFCSSLFHSTHGLRWTQQNWPASNVWVFIAQIGTALKRKRRGHGFESHWSPEIFFRINLQLLKLQLPLRRSCLHLNFVRIIYFCCQTKWEESKMLCWYYNDPPRLKIKPAKIERVFVKPEIFLFRDILSDVEMEVVKELAAPRVMYSCC